MDDPKEAFFTLHRDLPREGPGLPEDVAWAADLARLPADAVICDAGCGPGADIAALLEAAPAGHVTALDQVPHFIEAARMRHQGNPRVRVGIGDMTALEGRFDLIWCAGALYFPGLQKGLRHWRRNLRKGGAIAFSYPCYFRSPASDAARAMWAGEDAQILSQPAIAAQIGLAGYSLLGARPLSNAAWEAYYRPFEARIDRLWPDADDPMRAFLDHERQEPQRWRAAQDETGYLLCVVRPI